MRVSNRLRSRETRRSRSCKSWRTAGHVRVTPTFERLEERTLLSIAPCFEDTQSSPTWFETVTASAYEQTGTADDSGNNESHSGLIVRLTDDSLGTIGSVAESMELLNETGAGIQTVSGLGLPGLLLVEAAGGDAAALEASLRENPHVKYVEQNTEIVAQSVPVYDEFSHLYGLHNTGQTGGLDDADIDAPEAWDITTGSSDVIIAVIDSGVDYDHPDLVDNIWTNPNEIPGNGKDDDGNGFVDDVHGWNFHRDAVDGDPFDDNGHGTHVAGTIAAMGNNDVGAMGVSWTSKIMPVKFLDENNAGYVTDAIKAVRYVTTMREDGVNVRIMNNSWVSKEGYSEALEEVVKKAGEAGILFVAGAGNGNAFRRANNNDFVPSYPASYAFPDEDVIDNVISVTATDENDKLVEIFNYGPESVDLAAPGMGIYSTEAGGGCGFRSGTSTATPHVSGVAALVWSHLPYASVTEVRDAILEGVDLLPSTEDQAKLATGGRLNALGALTVDTTAPRAVLTPVSDVIERDVVTHEFTVQYTDNQVLTFASLDDADVVVIARTDPASQLTATLVSVVQGSDGPVLTATYRVSAPGGTWDVPHNGVYDIVLQPGQVLDSQDHTAVVSHPGEQQPAVLGNFAINVPAIGTFVVNTFDDTTDASLGDGIAADAAGNCSLRAAVMESNSSPGDNTIILGPGTYDLSLTGPYEYYARRGDLNVRDTTGSLTIVGAGKDQTTIDANQIDRVFDVRSGATLELVGLTATGGGAVDRGGGIRNEGTLTVTDSSVSENSATIGAYSSAWGGGILNLGTATISGSTISNNQSEAYGGGLYNETGTATISNSTISENSAVENGGGLYTWGAGDTLTINDSIISQNYANNGGGIYGYKGTVVVSGCTISDNTTAKSGAGIGNYDGILIANDSLIADNRAAVGGGWGYGGGIYSKSTLTVSGCTITGNTAIVDGSNNTCGGGIYISGDTDENDTTAVIQNTLIDDNASDWGGGIYNDVGGKLTVSDCVISNNSATTTANVDLLDFEDYTAGGGICTLDDMTVERTVIAGNEASVGAGIDIVAIETTTVYVIECTITENVAKMFDYAGGGGIRNGNATEGGGHLIVRDSTISNNVASFESGGILNGGTLTVTGSTISGNEAGAGAGIGNWAYATIENSTISGNRALDEYDFWLFEGFSGHGGGIYNIYYTTNLKDR